MQREPIRTSSGCIDGSAMISAGRGAELAMMDKSEMLSQLNDLATDLELEATLGNPADTERLSKAANHIRDAWATLYPLVDGDEITAADPEPLV